MAGTIAANARHNTNYRLGMAQHSGMILETGTYTPTNGATVYTTAGDSVTFASGITPLCVIFSNPFTTGLSTGGLTYNYDPDNVSVHWFRAGIECTTTATSSGLVANYVAIGWQ